MAATRRYRVYLTSSPPKSDFLIARVPSPYVEVGVVEFASASNTIVTPVSTLQDSLQTKWQKDHPGNLITIGGIYSLGDAAGDGDALAMSRLQTLEIALSSVTPTDPNASNQLLTAPPPQTNTADVDGVIVLITVASPLFVLNAWAKPTKITLSNREARAGTYLMTGAMTTLGGNAKTIQADFNFSSDLPLTSTKLRPKLTVHNSTPQVVEATITSQKTFTFAKVPIELPGDPPLQRTLEVNEIFLTAQGTTPGQQIFLTGAVTSAFPVKLTDPNQLIAIVDVEGGHLARLFIWRAGQAGKRLLDKTTTPLVVTFNANNDLVGGLPTVLPELKIQGVEYNASVPGSPVVTNRLNSIMKALQAASRLAPDVRKAARVLQATEKHFYTDDIKVEDVIFLALSPGLVK